MAVMTDQELVLEKKQAISLQGSDKGGRPIVRIVGKNFPGKPKTHQISIVDACFVRVALEPRGNRNASGGLFLSRSSDAWRGGGGGAEGVRAEARAAGARRRGVRGRLHALQRGPRRELPRRRRGPGGVRVPAGRGEGEAARRVLRASRAPVPALPGHLWTAPLQLRVRMCVSVNSSGLLDTSPAIS